MILNDKDLIFCLLPVPVPPSRVKVVSSEGMSVVASWSYPDSPNGIITHYNVYWRRHKEDHESRRVDSHYTHCTIQDLSLSKYQVSSL